MAYKYKMHDIEQHTVLLRERTATALRNRNRTEMLNAALRRHRAALQRHYTARSNAQSINSVRQVAALLATTVALLILVPSSF